MEMKLLHSVQLYKKLTLHQKKSRACEVLTVNFAKLEILNAFLKKKKKKLEDL